jgi:lipid-binding SYLF domain-containing protein
MRKALLMIVLLLFVSSAWGEEDKDKVAKRVRDAAEILQEIMNAPDKGIPEEVIHSAKCIVVIPHEVSGGFVVGGRYGKGVATCRTPSGRWSAPAFITITGGSWGAQIGVEAVDNVLMIMNQRGVDRLLTSKFKIGADASAAAGPIGRHAEAGTDWKLNTEILSYSRAKGLFAGVTLDGSVVRLDEDANMLVYGRNLSPQQILSGKVRPPALAEPFLAAVRNAEREAHARTNASR